MTENADYSQFSVLIVDDVPLNILLTKKMLTKLGLQIRTAVNGQDALDKISVQKPDLVLLDIMMPVMDGFEVLEHLQENPDTRDLKVVVLSALNNEPEILRAMKAGARDFVTKPVIMERLLNCVKQQLDA